MIIMEFFRNWIEEITECPCCEGRRGVTEAVLDYGLGPWYPCGYCDETGYVNIFRKIKFIILDRIYQKKWRQELGLPSQRKAKYGKAEKGIGGRE